MSAVVPAWGVLSAVDTRYDSGLRLGYRLAHRGNQGAEHRRIVAWGFNNDDGKLQTERTVRRHCKFLCRVISVNMFTSLSDPTSASATP